MTAPIIEFIDPREAEKELTDLIASLNESLTDFAIRASDYQLSAKEAAKWERITELQWLLDSE